jgi:hypothetical protein
MTQAIAAACVGAAVPLFVNWVLARQRRAGRRRTRKGDWSSHGDSGPSVWIPSDDVDGEQLPDDRGAHNGS